MIRPEYRPVTVSADDTADLTSPGRMAGGVLAIPSAQYESIARQISPVLAALNAVAQRMGEGSPVSAARLLGVPGQLRGLVPSRWLPWSADLARVDFVLSSGRVRVLESNSGSAVGGSIDVEAFGLAASGAAEPEAWCLPNTSRIQWACRRALDLGSDILYLPLWPWIHVPNVEHYFARSVAIAQQLGVELRLVSLAAFQTEVGRRDRTVVALKLFATLDAVRNDIDLALLGYTGHGSDVIWLQSEETAVLSSKALLASDAVQQELDPALSSLLPTTWRVGEGVTVPETTRQLLRDQRCDMVFKPLNDHGGTGVMFGADSSPSLWSQLLEGSTDGVVQRAVKVDPVPMEVVAPGQRHRTDFTGPCAFGAYFIQGRLVGVLARVDGRANDHQAINGRTGAILTAMVPQSSVGPL